MASDIGREVEEKQINRRVRNMPKLLRQTVRQSAIRHICKGSIFPEGSPSDPLETYVNVND